MSRVDSRISWSAFGGYPSVAGPPFAQPGAQPGAHLPSPRVLSFRLGISFLRINFEGHFLIVTGRGFLSTEMQQNRSGAICGSKMELVPFTIKGCQQSIYICCRHSSAAICRGCCLHSPFSWWLIAEIFS
jgi:hypothetical protein